MTDKERLINIGAIAGGIVALALSIYVIEGYYWMMFIPLAFIGICAYLVYRQAKRGNKDAE